MPSYRSVSVSKRGKSVKSAKLGGRKNKNRFRTNKRGLKIRLSRKFQMGAGWGDGLGASILSRMGSGPGASILSSFKPSPSPSPSPSPPPLPDGNVMLFRKLSFGGGYSITKTIDATGDVTWSANIGAGVGSMLEISLRAGVPGLYPGAPGYYPAFNELKAKVKTSLENILGQCRDSDKAKKINDFMLKYFGNSSLDKSGILPAMTQLSLPRSGKNFSFTEQPKDGILTLKIQKFEINLKPGKIELKEPTDIVANITDLPDGTFVFKIPPDTTPVTGFYVSLWNKGELILQTDIQQSEFNKTKDGGGNRKKIMRGGEQMNPFVMFLFIAMAIFAAQILPKSVVNGLKLMSSSSSSSPPPPSSSSSSPPPPS